MARLCTRPTTTTRLLLMASVSSFFVARVIIQLKDNVAVRHLLRTPQVEIPDGLSCQYILQRGHIIDVWELVPEP